MSKEAASYSTAAWAALKVSSVLILLQICATGVRRGIAYTVQQLHVSVILFLVVLSLMLVLFSVALYLDKRIGRGQKSDESDSID